MRNSSRSSVLRAIRGYVAPIWSPSDHGCPPRTTFYLSNSFHRLRFCGYHSLPSPHRVTRIARAPASSAGLSHEDIPPANFVRVAHPNSAATSALSKSMPTSADSGDSGWVAQLEDNCGETTLSCLDWPSGPAKRTSGRTTMPTNAETNSYCSQLERSERAGHRNGGLPAYRAAARARCRSRCTRCSKHA